MADEAAADVEDGGGADGSTLALRDDGSAGDADEDVPHLSVEQADQLTRMTVDKCALQSALPACQEAGHPPAAYDKTKPTARVCLLQTRR